ncbi:MAG: CHAP domain-containing protein [Myxococcaceae bacterium]|nr:CHAP domain-containing protein [Myxococcaceae bacterium]
MRVESRSQPQSAPSTRGDYAAPAPGADLARGHSGPQVLELQKKLNAAGIQPPLKLDGLLGPKTEAALMKLTGSKTFDATAQSALSTRLPSAGKGDDFETTSSKPTLPEPPAAQAVNVATQPPPAGSVAEKTLAIAQQELGAVDPRKTGADGRYHGWQKLQTIFEQATGWRPSDKDVQASSQPGGKSWCGIFACNVLQQAGANVKWDLTKGKMVGDVQHVLAPSFKDYRTYKTERQAFEASIKPGDVITLNGKTNHHAIVTSVNPDGTVNTIDGNKPHIGEGKFKLADVTSFYRPTAS